MKRIQNKPILCYSTCFVLTPAPTHLSASCFSAHSHLPWHFSKLSVHRAAPSAAWLSSSFVQSFKKQLDGYSCPKELLQVQVLLETFPSKQGNFLKNAPTGPFLTVSSSVRMIIFKWLLLQHEIRNSSRKDLPSQDGCWTLKLIFLSPCLFLALSLSSPSLFEPWLPTLSVYFKSCIVQPLQLLYFPSAPPYREPGPPQQEIKHTKLNDLCRPLWVTLLGLRGVFNLQYKADKP